jgi:hypothetical protein
MKNLLIVVLTTLLFTDCSEECPVAPSVKRFAGTYTGTGTLINGQSGTITLKLDSIGVSTVTYPPLSLVGTWVIDGTSFRSSNISNQESITLIGTVSVDEKTISGTFGQGIATTGGGTFSATKP